MIQLIKIIIFSGILLYTIFITSLLFAWFHKKVFFSASLKTDIFVSILAAVRNEENTLPELLKSLKKQVYPLEKFEIILIDDHSTDGSYVLMKKFEAASINTRVLSLSANAEGKKAAIRYGVECAKGELILTTDADCIMNSEWLSTIVSFQQATNAGLIIAPVAYLSNNSLFEKLLALEFASLVATGASSANLGIPILCNGANLAFLKSLYPEDKHVMENNSPSGEDIFFLLNVKKTMRQRIRFLKSFKSIVYTNCPSSLREFINQRKRWFSKSVHYTDPEILTCGPGEHSKFLSLVFHFICYRFPYLVVLRSFSFHAKTYNRPYISVSISYFHKR